MALYCRVLHMYKIHTLKLRKGSKNTVVVVRNSMAYPQTLKKKTPVTRAVVCNCSAGTTCRNQVAGGGRMSLKAITHLN